MEENRSNDEVSLEELEALITNEAEEQVDTEEVTMKDSASDEEATEAASEDVAEEETESEDDDWLIPGRFKKSDVSKLAESYSNLERRFSQSQNEMHNLKKKLEAPKKDPTQEIEQFAEQVKKNPVEAIRNIVDDSTKEQREAQKREKFEQTYHAYMQNKEFAELEPVMSEIAAQYQPQIQGTALENNPAVLDLLFFAAKGLKEQESLKKATQTAKKKGELSAMKKQKARVESGSSSQGRVTKPFNDLSLEEMEKKLGFANK